MKRGLTPEFEEYLADLVSKTRVEAPNLLPKRGEWEGKEFSRTGGQGTQVFWFYRLAIRENFDTPSARSKWIKKQRRKFKNGLREEGLLPCETLIDFEEEVDDLPGPRTLLAKVHVHSRCTHCLWTPGSTEGFKWHFNSADCQRLCNQQ